MITFHFSIIPQGFWGRQSARGVMLKEQENYVVFGAYKGLQIGIGHWTIGGQNFEFLLNFVFFVHVDGLVDYPRMGLLEKWKTFIDTHFGNKNTNIGIL